MQGLTLSPRGVSIAKTSLTPELLSEIIKELTVTPLSSMGMQRQSYPIYRESASRLYMPKCYALKKFGKIGKIKHSGETISSLFKGTLRNEQKEPVENIIKACTNPSTMGGILNVFCGGGKTTMALYCICALSKKTLIVVHKDFLLDQWKERIEQFVPDARIGYIKGKIIDILEKDIVIASLQSLSLKEYDCSLFQDFGTLVVDEVHHTSAEVFNKALFKISFAYTIGLTATLDRKDGLSKIFMWHLGDVVYKSTQRRDVVEVQAICIDDNGEPEYTVEEYLGRSSKLNYSKMLNNICSYIPRSKMIADMICAIDGERKVLVLSDRISQLKYIMQVVESKKTCGLYIGGMKTKDLKTCEDKQVIFATYAIASEGYDQKNLSTLVLASPKSDVVQSVGRILREKEEDRKFTPTIIDIVDKFSIFEKQWWKRKHYYREQKYTISIKNNDI